MDKHEDWNKTNSVIDRIRNSEMEESAAAEGQSSTQSELFESKLRSILFPEPIFSQYIGELSAKPSKPVKFPSVESVGSDQRTATLSDPKNLKNSKRPPKITDPPDQSTGTRKRPPVRPQYTRYLRTWKKSVSASDRLTGYLSNLRELHLAKLIAFIEQMHKSSLYTDLDLYVDNLCFPVHRLILACYAPFIFQKLERSRTKANCPIEKLKLVNIDAPSLAVLIGFMYTGLAHPNESNFLPVLNAAIHLFMFDFANAWVELYEHRFTNRTAQLLFRSNIARQYGWTDYQQMLNVALAFDFEHLLISDQFEALPVEQLRDILRLDNVGVVSEVVLYLAVLKWLNFDFEQRKQHALDLMALIRFPAMDENELFACYNPPILPEVIELPAIKALMADAFNLQMKQKTGGSASDRPGPESSSGARSYRGPRNYRLAGAYKPLELWCSLMPKVPGGRPAASCLRKERTPRNAVRASESSDTISPVQPSQAISKRTTSPPVSTPTDLPTTSLVDTSVASSTFDESTPGESTPGEGTGHEDRLKPEVRADIEQLITDGQRGPTKLAVLKSPAACHCKPVRHSSDEQCRRERAAQIIQRTYRRFHRRKASSRSDDRAVGPGKKRPADRVFSKRPSEKTSEGTSERTLERTSERPSERTFGAAEERPSVGRSSWERPSGERPFGGKPSDQRASAERAEKPSTEKPSTEEPSAEILASDRRPSDRRSSRRRSSSRRSSGRSRPKIHTKLFGKSSLKAEESDESKDSSIDEQLANRLALPEQSKRQKLKMKEKLKQDKILMSKDKSHWPSDEESAEARQFHSKAKDAERAKTQLNKSSTSSTEPFSLTAEAKKRRKGYEPRVPLEPASLEPVRSEESEATRSERTGSERVGREQGRLEPVGREQGRLEPVGPERVRPEPVEPERIESKRPDAADGKSSQPVPLPVPLPVMFPAPLTSARSREENETGHLAGSGKEPRTAAQRTEQLILYSDSINQEFCGFFICNFNAATPTAGSPDGQSVGWQRHFQFNQADNQRKRISAPYEPVVVSHGQSVYLVGGMQMKSKKFYVSKQVLRYQLNGRQLAAAAFSLRTPRVQHSCVVAGDRLYVICGCKKPNVPLNTVECVHLMSSRTQPSDLIKLPTFGRFGQSAVYFRSRLWIIGGIAKIDSNFHLLSEIWVLDVQNANKWIKSKFPVPIAFAGICSVNEEFIYVVGGRCVGLTGKLQPSEKVWCYSVTTRRWQQIASLNQPRCNCCCVALGDRIYTFGGSPENDAEHLRGQTGEYYELRNPNQGWRMLSKNLPASIAGQSITKISFF